MCALPLLPALLGTYKIGQDLEENTKQKKGKEKKRKEKKRKEKKRKEKKRKEKESEYARSILQQGLTFLGYLVKWWQSLLRQVACQECQSGDP